jgi:hypothetical protein
MKKVLAIGLLALSSSVLAATSAFSDKEVDIVIVTDTPAVRNGDYVTFAAESTFKVPADAKLPAGTKMKLIWTVNCVKKQQRMVLASIAVPGQPVFNVTREEMVMIAKKEPFVAPKDEISRQVMASVCR